MAEEAVSKTVSWGFESLLGHHHALLVKLDITGVYETPVPSSKLGESAKSFSLYPLTTITAVL